MVPDPSDDGDSPAGREPSEDGPADGQNGSADDSRGDSSWYGVEALSTAKEASLELLWPPGAGVWLRLAVVALFVGGAGGVPTGSLDVGSGGSVGGGDLPSLPDVPVSAEGVLAAALAFLAVVGVLAVLFVAVSAVMEFVLVESLRSREVRLRSRVRAYLAPGLRLFVFRLALGIAVLATVGMPVLAAVGLGVAVSPLLFVLALPALVLVAVAVLVGWAVGRLTTDFVVPAMLAEGRGVVDGWRRVWPLVREEWAQVGVYLLVRIGVGIGAGVAVSLATLVVSLVVAVPFALVAGVVVLVVGWSTPGLVALAALGAVFALAVLAVVMLARVAPMTFLRYYSLSVLARLDGDLDLVPRSDEGEGPV